MFAVKYHDNNLDAIANRWHIKNKTRKYLQHFKVTQNLKQLKQAGYYILMPVIKNIYDNVSSNYENNISTTLKNNAIIKLYNK